MTENGNGRSIFEINSRLFQIINYMSNEERRELESVLIADLSKEEIQKDWTVLLTKLSKSKKRKLLKRLEDWQHTQIIELRKHLRKSYSVSAECSGSDVCFTDEIKNLSNSGAFIQTDSNLYIGQPITLAFSAPTTKEDITINGNVVRIDSQGIGVKFNETLAAFS
ncbi:MAG: PilZ domain-containing protein [Desulfobacterales bacterium]|nr:MAG: PilZ domain-containing protein [Desulfobacterales bacterium]